MHMSTAVGSCWYYYYYYYYYGLRPYYYYYRTVPIYTVPTLRLYITGI